MPKHKKTHCRKTKPRRKKVVRKDGKRYYRTAKGHLSKLKGNRKPPRIKC